MAGLLPAAGDGSKERNQESAIGSERIETKIVEAKLAKLISSRHEDVNSLRILSVSAGKYFYHVW
jgi:hypothetical protein